mgnify:CR=1 FL=1
MKDTTSFTNASNGKMKFFCKLPTGITPEIICQVINHGKLTDNYFREYVLADTRKEITMKIHNYWRDHSEMLYPRASKSYMWLYYNEVTRKRLQTLQEENIKQLSYMIYMINKTKKGEIKR